MGHSKIPSYDLKGFNGLLVMSDIHIGATDCDYAHLEEALKYARKHKLAIGLNGDIHENAIVNGSSPGEKLLEQDLDPTEQYKYCFSLFEWFAKNGYLKFITRGNHDARSRREALIDICEVLAHSLNVQYLGIGGYIRFISGANTYTTAIQHGHMTSVNTWRELDRLMSTYPDAEVLACGHDHNLATRRLGTLQIDPDGNETVKITHQVRTGTYLKYAEYARNLGLPPTMVGSPIIKFGAKDRKIEVDINTLSWT